MTQRLRPFATHMPESLTYNRFSSPSLLSISAKNMDNNSGPSFEVVHQTQHRIACAQRLVLPGRADTIELLCGSNSKVTVGALPYRMLVHLCFSVGWK